MSGLVWRDKGTITDSTFSTINRIVRGCKQRVRIADFCSGKFGRHPNFLLLHQQCLVGAAAGKGSWADADQELTFSRVVHLIVDAPLNTGAMPASISRRCTGGRPVRRLSMNSTASTLLEPIPAPPDARNDVAEVRWDIANPAAFDRARTDSSIAAF